MKCYYDFNVFQYCVFFIQRIQVNDTKIERPKKIAGNLSKPKISRNFCKTPKNSFKICQQKNKVWSYAKMVIQIYAKRKR